MRYFLKYGVFYKYGVNLFCGGSVSWDMSDHMCTPFGQGSRMEQLAFTTTEVHFNLGLIPEQCCYIRNSRHSSCRGCTPGRDECLVVQECC